MMDKLQVEQQECKGIAPKHIRANQTTFVITMPQRDPTVTFHFVVVGLFSTSVPNL